MISQNEELYKLTEKICKTYNKKISKKKITDFYYQLNKLVKFSKIFTYNCGNTHIFIQDINAALLTLGIRKINTQFGGYSNNDITNFIQKGGDYDDYCTNEITQCRTILQMGGDYNGYCNNENSQCQNSVQKGGEYNGYCSNEDSQCNKPSFTGGKTMKNKKKKRVSHRLPKYPEECLHLKNDFNELVHKLSMKYNTIEAKFTKKSLYYLNSVSMYILKLLVD